LNVDLVKVQTRDGLRLDGIWRRPDLDVSSQLGVDIVILHHGVAGNFYAPGMFEEYSDALLGEGCAVLRVNNRGHDAISRAAGPDGPQRVGAAYEKMDECIHDWEAWVDFAQEAGYQRIGLWGHSLGATKSIFYMGTQGDHRVKCVVAGSPPRFSHSAFIAGPDGQEFQGIARQARKYLDAGEPQTLIDTPYPTPLLVSAEVFMDKYGPDEKYDVLKHVPNVRVPLLIMIGTQEAQTMMAFQGFPPQVERLAGELEYLTFESIPGADHAYTHQREHVWSVVRRWLSKI